MILKSKRYIRKLPYYNWLVRMRGFLEDELEEFPSIGQWYVSAKLVEHELNLPVYSGILETVAKKRVFHYCNFDDEREIFVDLSIDMFSMIFDPISAHSPNDRYFSIAGADDRIYPSELRRAEELIQLYETEVSVLYVQ